MWPWSPQTDISELLSCQEKKEESNQNERVESPTGLVLQAPGGGNRAEPIRAFQYSVNAGFMPSEELLEKAVDSEMARGVISTPC